MGKTLKKLIKTWNLVKKPLIIILPTLFLFFFGVYLFAQPRLSGDVSSHLLLAISPILKIGSPYIDIWEIKPPTWPLFMYFWSNLFGFSLISIKIINIIVMAASAFIIYLIYKKIFKSPVLEIIFISTIVILFSPLLNSIIMPTEMLGLLFSVAALLILLVAKKDFNRFYFSGLLFFAASQTKEPFTFTALAVIPVFIHSLLVGGFKKFIVNLGQFLLGMITALIVIVLYLSAFGSLHGYLEVYKFKQDFYPLDIERLFRNFTPALQSAERTFVEFFRSILILVVLAITSLISINKFKKFFSYDKKLSKLSFNSIVVSDDKKNIKYIVLFYAIGSFLGFGLGGVFGSHYLIQVVVPLYIIFGIFVSYLFGNTVFLLNKSKKYFWISFFVLLLSFIVILPKRQYLKSYFPKTYRLYLTDQVFNFEKRITELTSPDQCVLSVYGWGVSENYIYAKRRPCTRFFLANIVLQDWQKKEYRQSVIDNPPAVIAYQTKGSDMDIARFEREVVNVSKIIENCYSQDSKEKVLYLPKFENSKELQECIKNNSI